MFPLVATWDQCVRREKDGRGRLLYGGVGRLRSQEEPSGHQGHQ